MGPSWITSFLWLEFLVVARKSSPQSTVDLTPGGMGALRGTNLLLLVLGLSLSQSDYDYEAPNTLPSERQDTLQMDSLLQVFITTLLASSIMNFLLAVTETVKGWDHTFSLTSLQISICYRKCIQ